MAMSDVVITGGPGAGKTTLLAELGRRGYATVEESARAIIAQRLALGLHPRPDPTAFAEEMLRRDLRKFARSQGRPGWVFFDRSLIEAVGMLCEAAPQRSGDLQAVAARCPFHSMVFVLPPWPEIYVQDAERDQDFADAIRVHAQIVALYASFGYRLQSVAPDTVERRADRMLALLGSCPA